MLMRRLILGALAAGLLLIVFDGRASAYPQFQFSSGTSRCSQCHYAPDGGGLITAWGRDEAGDTISRGGDGAFLHGAWTPPSWLSLGADVRLAALANDTGGYESPEWAFFPMQTDLYARAALGDQFSVYLQGGIRGDTGREESLDNRFNSVADRFISYEHWLMWRPSATGPYLRAGRFYVPYGLRLVEHVAYVQRYTGFDIYQQTYNFTGGYIGDDWELHLSLFAPPPSSFPIALQAVNIQQSGGAGYAEKRFGGMGLIALQTRVGVSSEYDVYQFGAVGKLWLEQAKLLFMGEGDYIRKQVTVNSAGGENQFVSYLGANYFPIRGVMTGLAYEFYQEDLSVKGTSHNAIDLEVNYFPWAHFELVAYARWQLYGASASGTPGPDTASLYMLQFHYYL